MSTRTRTLPAGIHQRGWFGLAEAILFEHGDGHPGAACRGRHDLFDDPRPGENPDALKERQTAAAWICRGCPARPGCAWRQDQNGDHHDE